MTLLDKFKWEFNFHGENFYKFSFNLDELGTYHIKGQLSMNNNQFINSDEILIRVIENPLEIKNIYLNSTLLKNISKNTNGNYSDYSHFKTLLESIDIREKKNDKLYRKTIFSYSYIWILIIFLLSTEWYLRNRVGLL